MRALPQESDHGWISLGPPRKRSLISSAKTPLLEAVQAIVERFRAYWPLSVRQIHYNLSENPPLCHANKPGSTYKNTQLFYKNQCIDICARGRLQGLLPWESISDETRPVELGRYHDNVDSFVHQELEYFLQGYDRDLLQSQPNYLELVVEKNTVLGIVDAVARRFCVRRTSGRGYCTLDPLRKIARRYRASGKAGLIVLVLSDFDPEGGDIPNAMAITLRDEFGVSEARIYKVGLRLDQVRALGLQPIMTAKESSSRYDKFVADQDGRDVVHELEAVNPETLAAMLEDAITKVIDIDLFNREVAQAEADEIEIETRRQTAFQALGEELT
jgi:hypothetical protein